jgi:hypothetical protein
VRYVAPNLRSHPRRRGFSLMETALTTIIVGVGVLSLVELLAKGTSTNIESSELTAGVNLAKNIREMSLKLAFLDPTTPSNWGLDAGESATNPSGFNDINDLDGMTYSPPVDSRGKKIDMMTGWTQSIVVHSVDHNSLTTDVPNGTDSAVRVTVTVSHQGQVVTTMSWYTLYGVPPP